MKDIYESASRWAAAVAGSIALNGLILALAVGLEYREPRDPGQPGNPGDPSEIYFESSPMYHDPFARIESYSGKSAFPRSVAYYGLPIKDERKPDMMFVSPLEDGKFEAPIISEGSSCIPCHVEPGEYKTDI